MSGLDINDASGDAVPFGRQPIPAKPPGLRRINLAAPAKRYWGTAMFATSYVIIMAIAGLTAKQMGQSTLADETYAALATIPAATYLWREFRKRNLILTCAIIYFLLTLFSGAVQFAIFHYASFTQ
ncbi:MAG: hypothetical protein ACXU8U_11485, partial [Asticcacaulis sp.]